LLIVLDMEKSTSLACVFALTLGGVAVAEPGNVHGPESRFEIVDGKGGCSKVGAVCFTPDSDQTQRAETAAAPSGKSVHVAAFRHVAGAHEWTVHLEATPKKSWTGNAVFMVFDASDPQSMAEGYYQAMYQGAIKAGKPIAARLLLTSEEGFRAGHTYRVRVHQIISGREIVLAEGDLSLL
jgi:hypothetical protein